MSETPERLNGNRKLREGASVLTAVAVVVGIIAAVIAAWFLGLVESAEALAFLGPALGAATTWLWVKQSSKDAAETALAQPGTLEDGS